MGTLLLCMQPAGAPTTHDINVTWTYTNTLKLLNNTYGVTISDTVFVNCTAGGDCPWPPAAQAIMADAGVRSARAPHLVARRLATRSRAAEI